MVKSIVPSSSAPVPPDMAAEIARLEAETRQLRRQIQLLNSQLIEAERLADHDVLTPLLNRRAFLREVQRAIAIARRHASPACLIYLDVDGFKTINDRYGHATGDAALIAVAERLLAAVREEDVVGRIGGDEFAVLLQRADPAAATIKAHALRDAMALETVAGEEHAFGIVVTFGVREISGAASAEQALAEADAAMYLHKPNRS